MSFIRSEIVAGATRWRESLAGLGAVLIGVVLASNTDGAGVLIGAVLVVVGGLLIVAGIQRARFRRGGDGTGIVELKEGRLGYFGPRDGGVIDVADIASIDLVRLGYGAEWQIDARDATRLRIPTDATGADSLFDVFASLEGFETGRMLAAMEAEAPGRTLIWASPRAALGPRSH
ncbi:MAG: hypothetical protein AAF871_12320 [Pseudomonadota bacterium]